ncbi:MAG: helix-turn-helix domain-containing protein [Clostridia bacterium]|nr:helix-turn-helix domain-containing protein [Clostridia bacterium]
MNPIKPTFTNTNELPFTLSVEDMATFLGISRVGAYNLAHRKGFPSVRIGKRILIPRDRFLAWLNDLQEVSAE